MRKFRGEKSQAEFAEMIDKRQTVVSRLEDANYGKWTLQTLFEVASKLDVAVIVRFVDFFTFLKLTSDMSDEASRPPAYDPNVIEASASKLSGSIEEGKLSRRGPKRSPIVRR